MHRPICGTGCRGVPDQALATCPAAVHIHAMLAPGIQPTSHPSARTSPDQLSGTVERITFHNPDNGYCVLRAKVRGQRDLVTIIGHSPAIGAGEHVEVAGIWVNDRNHGLQFKAETIRTTVPTTLEGLEKYLGSGMIKGIGPVYAKKLVTAFGQDVFDVIEREPLERRIDRAVHVGGRTVDAHLLRFGIAIDPELRADERALTPIGDRAADELFIRVGTIHFGRVDQIRAEFERAMDGAQRLCIITRAVPPDHAHAAKAQFGDFGACVSERAFWNGHQRFTIDISAYRSPTAAPFGAATSS